MPSENATGDEKPDPALFATTSSSSRPPGVLTSSGRMQSKVSFALAHEAPCSLTATEQQDVAGARSTHQHRAASRRGVPGTALSLLQKSDGNANSDRGVRALEASEDATEPDERVTSMDTTEYDPDHPEGLLEKLEEVRDATDGNVHLKTLDRMTTAGPPWWLRRWSELQLFLNSTRGRANPCSTAVDAAIHQLTADVAAAEALEQAVAGGKDGGLCGSSAREVECIDTNQDMEEKEEEDTLLGPNGGNEEVNRKNGANAETETEQGVTMAPIVPVWQFIGAGQRMTHLLSLGLAGRLQGLLDLMSKDKERTALKLLGVSDDSGCDGTQQNTICPVLQCAHMSIMRKTIIADLFSSSMNMHRQRAPHISDGFYAQIPRVNVEYVTEEDARPVYDASNLLPPSMNEPLMMNLSDVSQEYRSFVIHIDYVRFQPSAPAARQNSASITRLDAPPLRRKLSWSGDSPVGVGMTVKGGNGLHAKPLISFTREDQLIAKILDNYEQYRMLELSLLPQLKSRRYYQDQLKSLRRQPHPTDEQKNLIATLSQLFKATCELERTYLRTMLSAWLQVTRLRGEDPDAFATTTPSLGQQSNMEEENVGSSLWPTPKSDATERDHAQRGSWGVPHGTFSLLSKGSDLHTSAPVARFCMYLRRHGERAGIPYVQGDDLLEYTPVIEGVAAPSQATGNVRLQQQQQLEGALDMSPRFQVLVFARTNTLVPPQFVGATSPRALSVTKALFFNETFELRTMQEPREILLHIVSVGEADEDHVVATVTVPPSLTRAYLLLPLQAPVSFTFRGRTHGKHGGGVLPGVISLSTTWTTTQGMTVEEVEQIFLSGDADPMDPQYEKLLSILRSHYMDYGRRILANRAAEGAASWKRPNDGAAAAASARIRTTTTSIGRSNEREPEDSEARRQESRMQSERLALLRRRWMISAGHATPQDAAEARLFSQPIPLEDTECHELQRLMSHLTAREERETTRGFFGGGASLHDAAGRILPLALSLSPLPRARKLKVWQERLQYLKAHRISSRKLEDHELLERYVILPKMQRVRGINLTPESQLNPRREERPTTDEINRDALASNKDSRVVVHVMKAMSLPQRSDGSPLEPFVEVSFVHETVHTRSEVGTAPSWFETLNIPFCPPDFDDETLSLIEDEIVISVYDKLEIPMASTTVAAGAISHETHYRTERRLLGTLHVPFFTLYEAEQARMEGQYPLTTPRWMLGYHPDRTGVSSGLNPLHSRRTETVVSYPSVQLYVALWPPLQRDAHKALDQPTISRLVTQLNVSAQLQHLHDIAMKWRATALQKVKSLSSVNPVANNREIEPFVFCTTGDLTLICRYLLSNGGPPPLTVKTVEEAIHFVSLLLFRIDTLTWGDNDVWSTNAELLRTREGDYEELSLLLAHFLRFLAPDEVTYVVTGRGTIHQHVVMVLHSFGGELRLIDPRTGWVCPVHDPHLSFFRDVHMVVSHDQLWANVQLSGAPHRMDWSLDDRRFWLPCFNHEDDNVKACLPFMAGLQRETLPFSMPDANKEQEIEQQLRKVVRRALMAWRNNWHPAFHHGVASVLRTLLEEAESERCKYASSRQGSVTMRATKLLNEYFGDDVLQDPRRQRSRSEEVGDAADSDKKMALKTPKLQIMGSPVNDAYQPDDVAYQHILEKVFETAVHEVGTNAVSFALAVYVKGYTNEVYSMWVFLVALYEAVSPR
ncbi:hypothetical protein DQ04_00421050 [Trypanosoma grayi]|uniref:hypothetical protein n=1 Tax=Trypanosoma grayi TaxID=71804 RepID=UPI0004F4258F|nr:hypothetical protein DQ04_00421050 [Trypanosoma grayi]KEG14526.1 hypothetical protein DQ04_00421050 [Trypanosoma grayi]